MLHPNTPTAQVPERTRPSQEPHPAQRVQVVERWNQWARVRFAETGEEAWVDLAENGFTPLSPEGEKRIRKLTPAQTSPLG